MKKIKNNKGITLVALIITIIVLLILAVVAISAVNGDGIISHAKNARYDYQTAQETENTMLGNYMIKLNEAQVGNEGKKLIEGKTLNPNCVQTSEIQTIMEFRGSLSDIYDSDYATLKYKLVYKNNNNEEIVVSVIEDTSVCYAVLSVKYKENEYRIASESAKKMNLSWGSSSYGIYDKANVWTIRNGTITGDYGGNYTCPHFTEVTNFLVFEGEWTIDEAKSTELGKQYLSSCLVDAE